VRDHLDTSVSEAMLQDDSVKNIQELVATLDRFLAYE
jgi:hypothetical protein